MAWRSEDSVESKVSSQSEAQPGIGCSAIPEAAQSGGMQKPGARAILQTAQKLCEAGGVVRGQYIPKEKKGVKGKYEVRRERV